MMARRAEVEGSSGGTGFADDARADNGREPVDENGLRMNLAGYLRCGELVAGTA